MNTLSMRVFRLTVLYFPMRSLIREKAFLRRRQECRVLNRARARPNLGKCSGWENDIRSNMQQSEVLRRVKPNFQIPFFTLMNLSQARNTLRCIIPNSYIAKRKKLLLLKLRHPMGQLWLAFKFRLPLILATPRPSMYRSTKDTFSVFLNLGLKSASSCIASSPEGNKKEEEDLKQL